MHYEDFFTIIKFVHLVVYFRIFSSIPKLIFSLETSSPQPTYLSVIRYSNQTTLQLSQKNNLFHDSKQLANNNKHLEAHLLHAEHRLSTSAFTSKLVQLGNYTEGEIILVDISDKSSNVEMFIKNTNESVVVFNMGKLNLLLIHPDPKQNVWLKTSTGNATMKTLRLSSSSLPSFSAVFNQTINFTLTDNQYARLDGWTTKINPFFDNSQGYQEGSGMYVVPSNGFYLVDISVLSDSSKKR